MTNFQSAFFGATGYEELRKYMRSSTDFSKECISIIQERADIEILYAKSLVKLSSKITKAGKECLGTLAQAWCTLATQTQAEGELHKQFGDVLHTELAKPFKTFIDQQIKAQKAIDSPVEKAAKAWNDNKQNLLKIKKNVHIRAKESEGIAQQMDDATIKKPLTEKELTKLQSKTKKVEALVVKADNEHVNSVRKVESARHDFELAIRNTAGQLQTVEEERCEHHKDLLGKLANHMSLIAPSLSEFSQLICQAVSCIHPIGDIELIAVTRRVKENATEQILYDSYEEDMKNPMKIDRRKASLMRKVHVVDQEIYKEKKTIEGMVRLSGAYSSTPSYAINDSMDSVIHSVHQSEEMVDLLEATKFKLLSAVAMVDKTPEPVGAIGAHIKTEKDKQGLYHSTLRRPRTTSTAIAPATHRGPGDGATLSSKTSDHNAVPLTHTAPLPTPPLTIPPPPSLPPPTPPPPTPPVIEATAAHVTAASNPFDECVYRQAVAKYNYDATQNDELTIRQGDVIKVLESMHDGWSKGELNGCIGVFPTSYI